MKQNLLPVLVVITLLLMQSCTKKQAKDFSYEYKPEYSLPFKIQALDKGVNLEGWLSDGADPSEYGTRFNKDYLEKIRALGFTSVRIPIGSKVLLNMDNPGELNTSNLEYVDSALSWAIQSGLAVHFDVMHQILDNSVEVKLKTDPVFQKKFLLYYKSVAAYFKKYPADKLFFEIFNEPNFGVTLDPFVLSYYWDDIQGKIIQEIRTETQQHYIIATGLYTSFAGIEKTKTYNDPKIIYNIHFYEPLVFTFQGAWWAGWTYMLNARNIPYPSTPENMRPFVLAATSEADKHFYSIYGADRYNAAKIDARIREIAAWAYRKRISLIVNEFGVLKPFATPQYRAAYIHDLRIALEKYHLPWTMWEFDQSYGIVEYPNGDRGFPVVDPLMLQALGLQ